MAAKKGLGKGLDTLIPKGVVINDEKHSPAEKAKAAAYALFGGSGDSENMPTTELSLEDLFEDKIGIVKLIVKCGFASSNAEAKRLIQQGGITVNDESINSLDKMFTLSELKEGLIVKKGKKHFRKAVIA